MRLSQADKKDIPNTKKIYCEIATCGKPLFFHKPFEIETKDKKGNPIIQYFGFGFVCPDVNHYHLRKPYGY